MALDQHPNDEEKLEKEDQDYDPPFSEPSDVHGAKRLPADYPQRDNAEDMDTTEWYNDGPDAAAGVDLSSTPRHPRR